MKHTFIHFDDDIGDDELRRSVSDMVDGLPVMWWLEVGLEAYVERILSKIRSARSFAASSAGKGGALGSASAGSARHSSGRCKPCGWHHKPSGCFKGEACEFCHLCPEGSLARWRRERRAGVKQRFGQVDRSEL